jgi:hypothetical protein
VLLHTLCIKIMCIGIWHLMPCILWCWRQSVLKQIYYLDLNFICFEIKRFYFFWWQSLGIIIATTRQPRNLRNWLNPSNPNKPLNQTNPTKIESLKYSPHSRLMGAGLVHYAPPEFQL